MRPSSKTPLVFKDLEDYMTGKKLAIDEALKVYLEPEEGTSTLLEEAIHYGVFSGGKRIRPIIVLAVAEMLGNRVEMVLPFACAIEALHACSLILDDLPCMDDALTRREKPSTHLLYGEARAILAADALLMRAFELMAQNASMVNITKAGTCLLMEIVARAVGTSGMIGGQHADLASKGKALDLKSLEYIHSHKTGALFRACVLGSAILCRANNAQKEALEGYAKNLGLAFQITDDILDEREGLSNKKDEPNFVRLFGLSNAEALVAELIEASVASLSIFGSRAKVLEALARYVESRSS